jgi:hypothetical protein
MLQSTLGNVCTLHTNEIPKEIDEAWISVTFTFDVPLALSLIKKAVRAVPLVRVGGVAVTLYPKIFKDTGADVYVGRIKDSENIPPDFSLLNAPPDYSITKTSVGCIRKCQFCAVRIIEPEFSGRPWIQDLYKYAKRIIFYDNNWVAKSKKELQDDIQNIARLVSSKQVSSVDFNQSLDCRLITDEIADMLKGLPIRPMRFAFDGPQEDGAFQKAITMMAKRGFTSFHNDELYNFTDTPGDLYYRMKECVRLEEELGVGVCAFPMRFQPFSCFNRNHVGTHWTRKMLSGFNSCLSGHSKAGIMACHSMKEFEYWFGKNPSDFYTMLNYNNIAKLSDRKNSALRFARVNNENLDGLYL